MPASPQYEPRPGHGVDSTRHSPQPGAIAQLCNYDTENAPNWYTIAHLCSYDTSPAGDVSQKVSETYRTPSQDDPRRLSRLAKPLLIDEWQHYPPVWDRVRHDVDAGAASGSYILAGSSFPSEAPKHSGAGRIVTLRMRPLSLAERQLAEPTVSLAALLDGTSDIDGDCDLTLEDYTDEITTSGFPGIRPLPPEVRRDALDGYLTAVVERDFVDAGASRTRGQCPSRGTAPCWERCSRAW